ncbi:MAG: phosphopyruvate hydratase [Patescibacteria group bacterium]|nr:phosphopyruvate hydratase [Patescibacteria group bacterium]
MKTNHIIKSIKAREILDSKGTPTIETELHTNIGVFYASVPSGVSKGIYEAKELRDNEKRYQGMGVKKAVENVEKIIAPKLKRKNFLRQKQIDDIMIKMDGTENKSRLGANAILSVSMAVCRAGASALKIPLYEYIAKLSKENTVKHKIPYPCFLMIEGGTHAGNNLDFQEFMIMTRQDCFSKNLRTGQEIYQNLKKILIRKYGKLNTNVGMEGGFAPDINLSEQALNLLMETKEKFNDKDANIILDVAASEFFKNKKYKISQKKFSSDKLLTYYLSLIKRYSIIGIEDPFAQNDWKGFQKMVKIADNNFKFIIGDDLTATNIDRVKKAVKKKAVNGIIIKPNQIGTISETIETIQFAKKHNIKIFVKHRSGETNDDFIADLAVGVGAYAIMAGAPVRGERVAKYNRLLKIEQELYSS